MPLALLYDFDVNSKMYGYEKKYAQLVRTQCLVGVGGATREGEWHREIFTQMTSEKVSRPRKTNLRIVLKMFAIGARNVIKYDPNFRV